MKSAKNFLHSKSPEEILKAARAAVGIRQETGADKPKNQRLGIGVPNAFHVPNEIVDEGWLVNLKGGELRVLIYIIRKTFGYNKIAGDKIPLSQLMNGTKRRNKQTGKWEHLDYGTGLSKKSCLEAVRVLEGAGLIEVLREYEQDGTRQTNYYRLITRDDYNIPAK